MKLSSAGRPFPRTVLEKASILVSRGYVSKISDNVYVVRSQHPKRIHTVPLYTVKKEASGKWTCSCEGYERRGICSHVIAVMIVEAKTSSN